MKTLIIVSVLSALATASAPAQSFPGARLPSLPAAAPTTADAVRETLKRVIAPVSPAVQPGKATGSPAVPRPPVPPKAAAVAPSPARRAASPAAAAPTVSATVTPAVTDGAVDVTSDPPGAEVILDSRIVGVTPLFVRGLVPGPHELELTRSGYPLHRRQIRIAGGKVLHLRLPGALPASVFATTLATGWLTVELEPQGASVYLPGRKLLGVTPLLRHPMKPGLYTLRLEAQGRVTEERDVTIDRGKETRIVTTLAPREDLVDVFRKRRRDRERDLYLAEGRRLVGRGEFDLALERTRQAIASDPRSAEAYELLAQIYNSQGDRAGYAEAAAKAKALRAPR